MKTEKEILFDNAIDSLMSVAHALKLENKELNIKSEKFGREDVESFEYKLDIKKGTLNITLSKIKNYRFWRSFTKKGGDIYILNIIYRSQNSYAWGPEKSYDYDCSTDYNYKRLKTAFQFLIEKKSSYDEGIISSELEELNSMITPFIDKAIKRDNRLNDIIE